MLSIYWYERSVDEKGVETVFIRLEHVWVDEARNILLKPDCDWMKWPGFEVLNPQEEDNKSASHNSYQLQALELQRQSLQC